MNTEELNTANPPSASVETVSELPTTGQSNLEHVPADQFNVKDFVTKEIGTLYGLPVYHIVEGIGLQPLIYKQEGKPDSQYLMPISFVRGSKLPNGEGVKKEAGIVHEALVEMMRADLQYKHDMVPSDESAAVLVHLSCIADLMAARAAKRKAAGTQGTMQK